MVIWTLSARADLKAIHDYIAKDAPQNANTVTREILRKADTLAELPRLGKTIPELNENNSTQMKSANEYQANKQA